MKFSFILFLIVLNCGVLTGQDSDSLARASELFKQFQSSIYSDHKKADAAFDKFLKMPDSVKERLQGWLDREWIDKRRQYEQANGRPSSNSRSSSSRKSSSNQSIKENRELLATIRAMADEKKMKAELKSKGWSALESLLADTKKMSVQQGSKPVPSPETEALLKQALTVGNYRYKLQKDRRKPANDPKVELGIASSSSDDDEAPEPLVVMDSDQLKVFEKNEKLKDEIPRAEFEGIFELNKWRVAIGQNPLLIDPKLCEAARDHSKDMAEHKFFSHTSPIKGKESPWDRAKNFKTSAKSENIAINGSVSGANKAWFHSPGHHKNMFREKLTYVGLGISGRHFTQLFR